MRDDRLTSELRALGRNLEDDRTSDETSDQANERTLQQVLDRIADEPPPRPNRLRRWAARARDLARRYRRRIAALGLAILVALAVTPPVRAAIGGWFQFGGVVVEPTAPTPPATPDSTPHSTPDPTPGPTSGTTPTMPSATRTIPLGAAADEVGFRPVVPRALGAPDDVRASTDRRLLSMAWRGDDGNRIRLDQFRAEPVYEKRDLRRYEFVDLDGTSALWVPEPHELVLLGEDGRRRLARPAGDTLVWVVDGTTLRLEGLPKDRATRIAGQTLGTP